MSSNSQTHAAATRREFIKRSGLVAATALASQLSIARSAHAAGGEELKVALVGCGARGTGAAVQALSTAGPVKLWAMADAFEDRLQISLKSLQKGQEGRYDTPTHSGLGNQIQVPPERQFVGLDAYRKAIDCVDVVILTEPPGLRPAHFEYAVAAGKHVFMEKPVATDAPGIRRVLAAAAEAKKKNLKVGVGLQRHHQDSYIETVKRLQDGAIGKFICLRCYWDGGPPAKTPGDRTGLTELQYQLRNWYFFAWLSGDHIVEQHVHNIDVCNWLMNGHPVEAQGMGGRQVRTGKEYGHIFDHHFVEFTYADGTKMFSQCRQIPGCWNSQSEFVHGAKGTAEVNKGEISVDGQEKIVLKPARAGRGKNAKGKAETPASSNAYQVEHDTLFDAIRNNKPYNEVEYGAMSTMTGILGRLATYSGKVIKWDDAFNSELSLAPDKIDSWDAKTQLVPDAEGRYPVAMPGSTKVV
jgi:myo-inositol 2-dehydrogenase / D-chiro-inositol 1-dehydrogenase